MIINTEWGAFDNAVSLNDVNSSRNEPTAFQRHVLPLTRWDNALDRISINPYVDKFHIGPILTASLADTKHLRNSSLECTSEKLPATSSSI